MSDLLDKLLADKERKFGDRWGIVSDPSKSYYIGVPLEPLCLQYLFSADIIPLDKIIQLRGLQDSCKTSIALSIARMFIDNGGNAVFLNGERVKPPIDLVDSIVGKDNKMTFLQVSSADEVKDYVFDILADLKELVAPKKRHNINNPNDPEDEEFLVIIMDSLATLLSKEETARALGAKKKGVASADPFPVAVYAKIWGPIFELLAQEIIGSNCLFIYTNHLKESINYGSESSPGGGMKEFLSITLSMKGKKPEEHEDCWKKPVTIKMIKNFMGSQKELPDLTFLWDNELNFRFDFDSASISLIQSSLRSLKSIGPMEDLTVWGGKYSSKSLEFAKLSPAEALSAVMANEEVVKDLYRKLYIHKRRRINCPIIST